MDKQPLIISAADFTEGIAESRYTGIEHIRNADLFSEKGSMKIGYKAIADGLALTGLPIAYDIDPSSGLVYMDSGIQSTSILKRNTDDSWTTISGFTNSTTRGIAIFKDYLFRIYQDSTAIKTDRYGPLSSSPSVSTAWVTFAASGYTASSQPVIPSIVGQDGILYVGVMDKVRSLSDATSAGSVNTAALDLKDSGYVIQSFTELGSKLLIGAKFGDNLTSIGEIFPWDRISSSFNLPISTGLFGVPQMITKNNLVYAVGGLNGQLIYTNGSSVQQGRKIGDMTAEPDSVFSPYWEAMASWNSGILIGLGKSAGTDRGPSGVWFLRDGIWQFFTVTGGDGSDGSTVEIGCVIPLNDSKFLVTWRVGSSYGIDYIDTTKKTTSYGTRLDSRLYTVGNAIDKRQFKQAQLNLGKPLSTGQGVKVSYRTDPTASFTAIHTWDFATLGAVSSHSDSAKIPLTDKVQIRVELTTGSSSSTTPEFLNLTFL